MRTVLLNTLEWFGDANDRQRLLADKQKRLEVGKANVTVAATMEIIRPVRSSRNSSTLCKVHTKLSRNVFKLIFVRENAWTARHQTVSDHFFFFLFSLSRGCVCLLASICLWTTPLPALLCPFIDSLPKIHCERPSFASAWTPSLRCQQLLSRFHFFFFFGNVNVFQVFFFFVGSFFV